MAEVTLIACLDETQVEEALSRLSGLTKKAPEVLAPYSPPPAPKKSKARQVAEMIAPRPTQTMRREALKNILIHYDSFLDTQGEGDPGMRVAFSHISRALKPFWGGTNGIDMLANRRREYESSSGAYRGTIYTPTPFGEEVLAELKAMGAL